MKILITEDEYSLADAIAETLQKENYTTKIMTNGEDGEDEALTGIYDLILLDVMLHQQNSEMFEKMMAEEGYMEDFMKSMFKYVYESLKNKQ